MKKIGKIAIPSIYVGAIVLIVGSITFLITSLNKYLSITDDYNYSIDNVFENTIPVVQKKETTTIVKPYISDKVKIGKYFYDYESTETEQIDSIIYYENTYMQNSGIDYISDNEFDIIAVLDGEVDKISEDELLGTIVQIKHENNLITIYQGIKDISVKQGEKISQSQIIGKSSSSSLDSNYKNYFHFEVYYKGEIIDPENFYSLSIQDFQ